MNNLAGTYKSQFDSFKLKIEVSPEHPDLFIFKIIDVNNNEKTLFSKTLQVGTSNSLTLLGKGIEISYNTDFSMISITETIDLNGNYQRI